MVPVLFLSGILSIYPFRDIHRTSYLGFEPTISIKENTIEREMQDFSAYLRKHIGYLAEMIGISPAIEKLWIQAWEAMRQLGTEPPPSPPTKIPKIPSQDSSEVSGSPPPPTHITQPNSPAAHSPFSPLGGHLQPLFPNTLPRHKILKELARGRYGVVELAIRLDTGELIAIKTLNAWSLGQQMTDSWYVNPETMKVVKHFLEVELKAFQQIGEHPHIVQMIGSAWQDDILRIAMTYVEGKRLSEYAGMLDENVARRVMAQLLGALDHCHQHRVVHSDLKPDNIIITDGDKVTLVDFGGSRMTRRDNPYLPRNRIFPGTEGCYDDLSDPDANLNVVQRDIIAAGRTLRKILEHPISELARRFIEECEQGKAISELLKHPWLQIAIASVKSLQL